MPPSAVDAPIAAFVAAKGVGAASERGGERDQRRLLNCRRVAIRNDGSFFNGGYFRANSKNEGSQFDEP
jgi:hypothetical protein